MIGFKYSEESSKFMRVPLKQLDDLGFLKVKENLFMKEIKTVLVYRDYRSCPPISYAYLNGKSIPVEHFSEVRAIRKIEFLLSEGLGKYMR